MGELLDLTNHRWILPYKKIEETLVSKGSVTVRVSSEGEAFDVQVWAQHRGYRVVRVMKHPGGVDVDLERQTPAEGAQAEAKPARPALGVEVGDEIETLSARLTEPLFLADLILRGRSLGNLTFKAPSGLRGLAEEAAKAAGGGCVMVSFRKLLDLDYADVIICRGRVVAAHAEAKGSSFMGAKALELIEGTLKKLEGTGVARLTVVDESIVRGGRSPG